MIYKYIFHVLIAIDQLLNTILGGYPDESISARCWREQRYARYIIDVLFFWQFRLAQESGMPDRWQGHCELCYEYEQDRNDLPEEYVISGTDNDIIINVNQVTIRRHDNGKRIVVWGQSNIIERDNADIS